MRDFLICLHCADLHVGKNRKFDDYLTQQLFMLEGIIGQVKQVLKDNPSADVYLCLSGDVFDRNQDTRRTEFVLFLTAFIQPLIALKRTYDNLQVFIIDGNHDRSPNPDEPSMMSSLASLFAEHFHFAVVNPKFNEEHSMLMLPYGGYSAPQMRTIFDSYSPTFVMAHECLARMQTDTGWTPPRNQDHYAEIDDVLEDNQKIAGVFLGDIHKCQSLDRREIVWYSGSPVTLDHGHRNPKGVLHHFYKRVGGETLQVKKPVLTPIDDPRIKGHYQLGVITDIDNIPWARCYQFFDCYIDLVTTPEVYAEISKKISGFFHSKHVSHNFKETLSQDSEQKSLNETEVNQTYYKLAIRDWSDRELDDFPDSLREVFIGRTEKLFEGRG